MKKLFFKTIFCMLSISVKGQNITTIFDATNHSTGIVIHNDILYVADYFDGDIYKVDLTDNTYPVSIFAQTGERLEGIAIYNNHLFTSNGKKIDITQQNPLVENFFNLAGTKAGIAFRGNELYVNKGTSVYLIDANQNNPTPIEIIKDLNLSTFGTIGMCVLNDYLYVTEDTSVVKYNLNNSNPVKQIVATGLSSLTGITSKGDGNTLFIVSYIYPNTVYSLNTATNNYTTLFSDSILVTSWDILHYDNAIYLSNIEGGEVFKVDTSSLSNGNNDAFISELSIYPNPVSDIIYIDGLYSQEQAVVFNTLGQPLMEVNVTSQIDISNLNNGIYFLKIGDRLPTKIIKK